MTCKCDCAACAACETKEKPMSTTTPPILPRSKWTTTTSKAGPVKADQLRGVAVHYPASPVIIGRESEAAGARRLEGYRRDHVGRQGWRDIAYNVAVDQAGRLWVLRGLSRQAGANGTRAANEQYGAILALVGNGEDPTPELIAGIQYAIRLYDVRFPGKIGRVAPHSAFVDTACPGVKLRHLLNDGRTLYVAGARRRWPNVKP